MDPTSVLAARANEPKPAQDRSLNLPRRSAITVQTYETQAEYAAEARRRKRESELELRRLSQPDLPIRYVDRETLENEITFNIW